VNKTTKELVAGVVQMTSGEDLAANLRAAGELAAAAGRAGAELVVLPENFAFMGEEARKRELAEDLRGDGPIVSAVRMLAQDRGMYVVAGGIPEKSGDPWRPHNTSALFGPDGRIVACYRKLHLFDVDVGGTSYRESDATRAGEVEIAAVDVEGASVGMTICYDVRFPELYRRLAELGARIFTVPAAFTLATGKDHWHTLLRARAIENQAFVLAAAQIGEHPRGRRTYGKSMIVDPWGDVIAQASDEPGFVTARLDFGYQDRVRAKMPVLRHTRI
jgi:predicted amidohydrolase